MRWLYKTVENIPAGDVADALYALTEHPWELAQLVPSRLKDVGPVTPDFAVTHYTAVMRRLG